jgi:hypothetical protein
LVLTPRADRALPYLLVGATLLAVGTAAAADHPIDAEACALATDPSAYRGRVVRVRGTVLAGLEIFALGARGCEDRIWLEMSDAGPSAMIGGGGVPRGRVILNVTMQQFIAWAGAGMFKEPSALPWRAAVEEPPITPVRNKTWRKFAKKVSERSPKQAGILCLECRRYTVDATLIGRFDHSAQGFVSQDAQGRVGYTPPGFGHMNGFPFRLVVVEVESFRAKRVE